MTSSTEQERSDFEAQTKYMRFKFTRDEEEPEHYLYDNTQDAWRVWQAARRAPVVAVPQGLRDAAQRAHDWMERQQRQQSKGGHATFDMMMLREERDALAAILAAAPQPPEAGSNSHEFDRIKTEAAPVRMPEPQAEVEVRSMKTYLDLSIHEWRDTLPDGCYKVYTEQQVCQLLAAHGIKVAP